VIHNEKKKIVEIFKDDKDLFLFEENEFSKSNYWLQTLIIKDYSKKFTKKLLYYCNKKKLFLRPAWSLLYKTKYLKKFPKMDLSISEKMPAKLTNLPSSCY
jgi:perosamine synthetase